MKDQTLLNSVFGIAITKERNYGLDIIRSFAILFVVIGHGGYLIERERYQYIEWFIFDGVSIFFVLSGFLIGGILLRILSSNNFDLKTLGKFWARRWLRTLPNYFLVLWILLLLELIFNEKFNVWNKFEYFLFSQNLYTAHPAFFPEAWSLSIEEWFYLTAPLLILCFNKLFHFRITHSLLVAIILIIFFSMSIRFYRYEINLINDIEDWDLLLRKQVITRLDSLMFGMIGAYVFKNFKSIWYKYKVPFFVIGILLFATTKLSFFIENEVGIYQSVFSFTTVSIGTLFILPFLSSVKSGKGIVFKYLTFISLISYPMYLVNLSLVQYWVLKAINWTQMNAYLSILAKYGLYWILTILISYLITKYFEQPILRFRDKSIKSKEKFL
ncbi:hypothetical protein AAU57_12930 [Nonlabens sp. YIK11]|uniref:acyltransferase family protein n=1 Tax=Nonlabens sp. YIK11 TaxID=1453349 RepID=UPI0006DBF459|nr:acyltransferase [Nonlabens sp. YIK11]KQC34135.1 hypothetical protein AAU57_12930 [Nonlabens sp. YIK11]